MTTVVTHKAAWTKPGQMRKALAAAVAAVVGPAIIAGTDNGHGSVPTLALWLIAAIAGLAAFAGVFWFPNDPEAVAQVEKVADKVAVDVVEHKPTQAVIDATQAVMAANYLQRAAAQAAVSVPVKPAYTGPVPPLNPAPTVSFVDPVEHVVPVSEPVGATAVSATP